MSEIQIIIDAIDKIGFPIVAFLLMFWFAVRVIKDNTKAIHKLTIMIERSNLINNTPPHYQKVEDKYRVP